MKKSHPLLPVPSVGARAGAAALLVAALCCLGACAPQGHNADAPSKAPSDEPAIEVSWSMEGDCSTCDGAEEL